MEGNLQRRRHPSLPDSGLRKRRRRGYAVSIGVGLLMAVLAPLMRDAWSSALVIALGSGFTAALMTWLLIRFQFEPLHRTVEDREATLRKQAGRQEFGARLNRALERSRSEPDALKVTMRAVETVAPGLPAEALVADSSRAHLRRQASTAAAGASGAGFGCQVVSPWDCPALSTSQVHHFPDSRELDACHFLSERADATDTPLTALCLPMASRGQALGVLHAARPANSPIDEQTQSLVATIAGRAGVTIGATRAFAKSQLQASTDPLTGLLNRRSFEERAATVLESAEQYALIMADLDNFKILNDLHGHSTGDRALRRFAEVLRSVTRADDIVARIGGEEFLILVPFAGVAEGAALAERLRARLRASVGRTEPAFTVSLGVAEGARVEQLPAVTAAADQALYAAKAAGRDQVVVASAPATPAVTALPGPRDGDLDASPAPEPAGLRGD